MCPEIEYKRVPPFFGVPNAAYQSPPCRIIAGTVLSVSTLLITVGQPYSPTTAGKGGLIRGYPRLPSSDSINADSSPHSYAPAPVCPESSKLNPLPRIFWPRKPRS